MNYTNSPLVTVKILSPNHSGLRKHPIEVITIHCFVGQVTAKRGCEVFLNPAKKASCNYVVGKDGDIGLCVEEKHRAWTTGGSLSVNGITGAMNDQHAVTIEVASDTEHPYAITDRAYRALVDLCTDICERNGIKELKWEGDKNLVGRWDLQNLTVHRWFHNKACPGDYIYSRLGQIEKEVNSRLQANNKGESKTMYNKIADMPEYAKDTIKKLIDKGALGGTGTGAKDEDGRPADLALTYEQVRLLVIIDRAHTNKIW